MATFYSGPYFMLQQLAKKKRASSHCRFSLAYSSVFREADPEAGALWALSKNTINVCERTSEFSQLQREITATHPCWAVTVSGDDF